MTPHHDGPRPHDAQPAHGLARAEAARPHPSQVQRDERAGAAQAGVAARRHGAGRGVDDAEEGGDDGVGRAGAVGESEAVVREAPRGQGLGGVPRLVEAHDGGHAHAAEDVGAEGGAEGPRAARVVVVRCVVGRGDGALERNELAGHHLLQVAVGGVVVVAVLRVLVRVDGAPHVVGSAHPAVLHALLEASPAVDELQRKVGHGVGCVAVWFRLVVGLQRAEGVRNLSR